MLIDLCYILFLFVFPWDWPIQNDINMSNLGILLNDLYLFGDKLDSKLHGEEVGYDVWFKFTEKLYTFDDLFDPLQF